MIGRVGCVFNYLIVTGLEREAFVTILWRTCSGVGSNGTRSTSIETAGSYCKYAIVWCIRSDAGVVRGAIVLSVGAKIPCILWPVPVSVKSLALFPSLFYVGEMPWR